MARKMTIEELQRKHAEEMAAMKAKQREQEKWAYARAREGALHAAITRRDEELCLKALADLAELFGGEITVELVELAK